MDLEVRNLSVAIGGKTIIHDVSAEVKSKRFVGIVGPNGSGKSTTLKTIYRVLKPPFRDCAAGWEGFGRSLLEGIRPPPGSYDTNEYAEL